MGRKEVEAKHELRQTKQSFKVIIEQNKKLSVSCEQNRNFESLTRVEFNERMKTGVRRLVVGSLPSSLFGTSSVNARTKKNHEKRLRLMLCIT